MHGASASARLLHLPTNRLAVLRALAGARRGAAAMAPPAASGAAQDAAPAAAPAPGTRPKVLVLTGPTAVGKTKASLALAEALGGEIISADSVQVYRRLDIGSDKIRAEEQRGIPHHLINVLDPDADFSAGDFFTLARAAAEDILKRGKTPIVVGGTGFYLRWFILGKPATPSSTPASEAEARQQLEQAYADAAAAAGKPPAELSPEDRWDAGCALVERLGDAVSAERLRGEPNNQYRLLRVVDILLQTGRTLAELDLDAQRPTDYDCRCFFLHRPRAELYRRIDGRVEEMVASGLLTECQEVLLDAGIAPNSNCASRAIGYRQASEALQRWHADPGSLTEQSIVQAVQAVQAASRQLCHKQMTWFRDEDMFRWIDATQGEEAVLAELLDRWAAPRHEGGCGDSGRLTKEQEREMRRYTTKLRLYHKGSPEMQRTLAEARQLVAERAGRERPARPPARPPPGAAAAAGAAVAGPGAGGAAEDAAAPAAAP